MGARLSRELLETFLAVVEAGSVQAASRATGQSRTTIQRRLKRLERALDAAPLFDHKPGGRRFVLTPAGHELTRRARAMLEHWDRSTVALRDAVGRPRRLRLGTLAGSFDLLADLLADLSGGARGIEPPFSVVELPDDQLLRALEAGEVDLAFGTQRAAVPKGVRFHRLGSLGWAAIVPAETAHDFPDPMDARDIARAPLVGLAQGPSRTRLARWLATAPGGPFVPRYAFEAGSTPRVVEMVGRGFGVAVVSRFRLSFLSDRVAVRRLVTEPDPIVAGTYERVGAPPWEAAAELLGRARARFRELAETAPPAR